MEYGIKKSVSLPFDDAVEVVRTRLAEQGFGVLTEIDVKATLKKKLDVDMDRYLILGACNPPFAHQALQAEDDIGLLLPCNVIVYEKNGQTVVNAVKPSVAMGMVTNPELEPVAKEVEARLTAVIEGL